MSCPPSPSLYTPPPPPPHPPPPPPPPPHAARLCSVLWLLVFTYKITNILFPFACRQIDPERERAEIDHLGFLKAYEADWPWLFNDPAYHTVGL
ncbi:unnamed protein product [Rodentolepis nana]|uniref:Mannosyltransferase n=1 Tax=Rodentolepis nana TaxID=102285 RepID=A0A0R3TP96_RODNA|nr:unnamed protein product [Rodentolepis nana]